jgi:hypothetical protein
VRRRNSVLPDPYETANNRSYSCCGYLGDKTYRVTITAFPNREAEEKDIITYAYSKTSF